MPIKFSRHAKFKIALINEDGFPLTTDQVIGAIKCPEFVTNEEFGRMGAYRSLDRTHAVRVIYEELVGTFTVITVMIVRRMRYER